jgi:hypothetical protein
MSLQKAYQEPSFTFYTKANFTSISFVLKAKNLILYLIDFVCFEINYIMFVSSNFHVIKQCFIFMFFYNVRLDIFHNLCSKFTDRAFINFTSHKVCFQVFQSVRTHIDHIQVYLYDTFLHALPLSQLSPR